MHGGGEGLPNFLLYHKAVMVARILDCFHYRDQKQWVQIESDMLDINPRAMPWIAPGNVPNL